ncbi:MAG TPA: potassium channel family protein [Thermoleophilaceae bacterium]|jgi:voltage-gated potassium channel
MRAVVSPGNRASVLNWAIWLTFSDRWAWIRTHPLEVVITVLTPPILPAGLQALRVFRLLRVLRLFVGAKIARRLLSTEGVRDAAVLALVTVITGGVAFSAVESDQHYTAWDGVWWAMSTVTTVGYGDEYPTTTPGRLIAVVLMLVGIGFVAILTAAAADRFLTPASACSRTPRRR